MRPFTRQAGSVSAPLRARQGSHKGMVMSGAPDTCPHARLRPACPKAVGMRIQKLSAERRRYLYAFNKCHPDPFDFSNDLLRRPKIPEEPRQQELRRKQARQRGECIQQLCRFETAKRQIQPRISQFPVPELRGTSAGRRAASVPVSLCLSYAQGFE